MRQADSKPVTILFVGRPVSNTATIEAGLELRGYRSLFAPKETDLAPILNSQPVSLALLEVGTAVNGDVQIYHQLRSHPAFRDKPVIVATDGQAVEERADLLAQGVNDFLLRPYSIEDLLARIEIQLRLVRLEHLVDENARRLTVEQTQRKQADLFQEIAISHEKLWRSARLAATGRLAASWAHEINNPLQAVHSCLQLAIHFDLEPEKQAEYIGMACEEVERMIDIVTRILDFARPSPGSTEQTNINKLISRVIRLSSKHMAHNQWEVQQNLASDIPEVQAIPDQINQLFLNIVLNAFDAMPDGGKLHITTSYQKDWVLIRFEDNGAGMPPDVQEHIFEPFYTTKAGASGLGLSLGYGIVSRHGGHIEVESEVGMGTAVTVFLPVLHREAIKSK